MKKEKLISFLLSHKRDVVILSLAFIPALAALIYLGSQLIAHASFGIWGDSSLVHACEDSRGRITIVAAGASCNTNETQVTWLKDVDAGTGLTITRSSSGATLSLANTNADGWNAANETWTYASSDAPTYTFTVSGDETSKYSPGMRVKLTQTSTKYFLITAVSYSSPNTTVTLYGGTDYSLANATITNPYYSTAKAPQGFPLDPSKWTVEVTNTSDNSQASPTAGTWYNMGSLSIDIPIGVWNVSWNALLYSTVSSSTQASIYGTLSLTNSSEDKDFTALDQVTGASANMNTYSNETRSKTLNLTSKATYYLNEKTGSSGISTIGIQGGLSTTVLRAVSAYL